MNIIKIFNKIHYAVVMAKTRVAYSFFFKKIGRKTVIYQPCYMSGCEFISIGDRVMVRSGCRLEVIDPFVSGVLAPEFIIGNNVNIEQNVHIVCGNSIVIGNDVSIAGGAAIVDVFHPYADVDSTKKIGSRISCKNSHVTIKDGAFIGFGAIIMPNVTVGKCAVVGAHSVVINNVPDYAVVAGNPARTIKIYDFDKKEWVRV